MPDALSISGAISGLKTAAEITKSFLELKNVAEVQSKVIELQSVILTAQSQALASQAEQADMLQRVRELGEEVRRLRAWEQEKENYYLFSVVPGVFVYALTARAQENAPPHWLCVKCYEDGRKSILQVVPAESRTSMLECIHCKARTRVAAHTGWVGARMNGQAEEG